MTPSLIAAIRFGYGPSAAYPGPSDAAGLLAALTREDLGARAYPVPSFAAMQPDLVAFQEARRDRNKGMDPARGERFKRARNVLVAANREALRARLLRAVMSPEGFRERLVAFWADHFTVRDKRMPFSNLPSVHVEDAIRPHVAGRFAEMLTAATVHPAMLAYLDQDRAVGPASPGGKRQGRGLNENLAREVLELHSLGVEGAYTQADVRQFAELLTGLTFNFRKGPLFRPNMAEPGAETVLGEVYGGEDRARIEDIHAALEDIAAHPATARHIARKLAVHFISDTPPGDLVETMARAYTDNDGALMAVYAAMLGHPAAWAPVGAKLRQPWDFVIAALRATGTTEARLLALRRQDIRRFIAEPLAQMGQPFQQPPGPDGWPEEAAAWINPPGLAARLTWARNIGKLHDAPLPDPGALMALTLGDGASRSLVQAVPRAESEAAAVALILSSPDFNRR